MESSSDDEGDTVTIGRPNKGIIQDKIHSWGQSSKRSQDSPQILEFSPIRVVQNDEPNSSAASSSSQLNAITVVEIAKHVEGCPEKREDVKDLHKLYGQSRKSLVSSNSRIFLDLTGDQPQRREERDVD